MSNIFLYTGQGAQSAGMGKPFMDYPTAVELFTLFSDITGRDVVDLITNADEATLKETQNTQVAIAVIQGATTLLLAEHGITADATAGFSLGEIAAYWQAGIFSTEDFARIIAMRGKIMQEQAAQITAAHGEPGMAAIMGLEKADILKAIEPIDHVYGANYNSPNQTVIAGTMAGIELAAEALKAAGARRVVPLKVSGPFHTPLMQPAAEAFAEAIAGILFMNPTEPVYANATAGLVESAEQAKELLVQQLTSPVRWVEIEEAIIQHHSLKLVAEVGPGKVLAGLWKGIDRTTTVHSVGTPEAVVEAMAASGTLVASGTGTSEALSATTASGNPSASRTTATPKQ